MLQRSHCVAIGFALIFGCAAINTSIGASPAAIHPTRVIHCEDVDDHRPTVVTGVALTHDAKTIAAATDDNRVLVWDAATGTLLRTLLGHSGEVNVVAFSPDGKLIASAGEDSRILLWDATLGQRLHAFEGHQAPVRTIAFSRDGQTLASGGEDSRILIWNVPARALTGAFPVTGFVNSVAFNANGNQLFSAGEDNQITRWSVASGKRELSAGPN